MYIKYTCAGQVCGFNVAVHGCDDERRYTCATADMLLYP